VAVGRNSGTNADEAYVVTSGSFDLRAGLNPIPSLAIFDVSVGWDPPATAINRVTNTPPDRVVVNPLLGPAGMALDQVNQRLYVASFYSNMILVYDEPQAFVTGAKEPTRIIAGPKTMLDHPVSLLFRRDVVEDGALYVVNQSSHSVAVFNDGDGTLSGDVAPDRYLGAPEGTDPKPLTDPFDVTKNKTEMVFPTGVAIDPDENILYVSNRDAAEFQDLVGRRIVAFKDASTIGEFVPALGIRESVNNVTPSWKIEGDAPPSNCNLFCPPPTDKTTLKRPTGLFLIPDGDNTVAEDWLIVANREKGTVLIFRGVSTLVDTAPSDHNLAPTWTIAHAAMGIPFGLTFNAATMDLYVSDLLNQIFAFDLNTLSLDQPVPSLEARLIKGSSTGLRTPHGMALDPQLDPQN
jgi:DNA-binding beta-propeller fold protein YncE